MRKRFVSLLLSAAMLASLLTGCTGSGETPAGTSPADTGGAEAGTDAAAPVGGTVKVAAAETAYGAEMWKAVADAFTAETGIGVELIVDKNLEDVISPDMKAGNYPDVIMRAVGTEFGMT